MALMGWYVLNDWHWHGLLRDLCRRLQRRCGLTVFEEGDELRPVARQVQISTARRFPVQECRYSVWGDTLSSSAPGRRLFVILGSRQTKDSEDDYSWHRMANGAKANWDSSGHLLKSFQLVSIWLVSDLRFCWWLHPLKGKEQESLSPVLNHLSELVK